MSIPEQSLEEIDRIVRINKPGSVIRALVGPDGTYIGYYVFTGKVITKHLNLPQEGKYLVPAGHMEFDSTSTKVLFPTPLSDEAKSCNQHVTVWYAKDVQEAVDFCNKLMQELQAAA